MLLSFVAFAFLLGVTRADTAADIKDLTGAPTRVVWIQDAGDTACVYSEKPTLRLMVYDTEDGQGERQLLPDIGWYAKPVITADGTRVAFNDIADHTVKIVNWDGTGLRTIVTDVGTFQDLDIWTDQKTGFDWIYSEVMEKREGQTVPVIRRYRVDDPKINELIWDKTKVSLFRLSGDGRVAAGGGDGGNTPQGRLVLPNVFFQAYAGGCWPSMAPDNSHLMWVFTGNHRSVHMCFPVSRSGNANVVEVRLDGAPGLVLKNNEEMYHPRWTNNVHFLTVTSPYSDRHFLGGPNISNEVAAKVEVYIGKFKDDFMGVERYVQVTHNDRGDYWPAVWIKPSKTDLQAMAAPTTELPEGKPETTLDQKGLEFTWDTGAVGNQIIDPKTGAIRQCTGQLRHNARYARNFVMDMTDGSFVPDDTATPLLTDCKASNEFALETLITPTGTPSEDEAVVMAFADDMTGGNFVLAQQGEWLTLRLKTDGGPDKAIRICPLTFNQPNHIIVSYAPGHLACYVNGKRAIMPNLLAGGLSNWTPRHLIFGDAWQGGHNWAGLMEDINLFSRAIPEAEARQRFLHQQASRTKRTVAARAVVEAKLLARCAAADPQGIAPYRRCLSVQQYEVDKVVEGKLDDKIISVAQWSVLDGKVVPTYDKQAVVGQTYRLTLEKWEDHPEQESERSFSGDFQDNGVLYYDVLDPQPPPPTVPVPQTCEWIGPDGNPNTGGAWEATTPAVPWKGGKAPGVADTAVLGAVTQGQREITTINPVMIQELDMTSGHAGAINRLKLGDSLTLEGNDKPLNLGAGPGSELDLNGQDLLFDNLSLAHVIFNGKVRLAGNGAITAVTVLNKGFGYTEAPTVQFNGGGGQGATGEAIMGVASLNLTSLGTSYTSPPTVTLSEPDVAGGRQAIADKAQIDKKSGAISGLQLLDPGTGYLRAPKVTFSGGGGSGADAETTLALSDIIITNGGSGYATPPDITLANGGGQEAQAQAALQKTTLHYTGAAGGAFLSNAGTVDQDGGALFFDWAALQNNTAKRGFLNSGTWTMQHGSQIQFISSSGRPPWQGSDNTNTGTLRLLDGSGLGVKQFVNSGQLKLGAGTVLGSVEYGVEDGLLNNNGTIKVLGSTRDEPAIFGCVNPVANGKRTLENGTADGKNKADLVIGSGTDTATFVITGGHVDLDNFAGSSLEINSGGALALLTNDNGSGHRFNNREAKLTNASDMLWSGLLRVQGNHAGFTGIDNTGHLTISGSQVALERLISSSGPGAFYQAKLTSSHVLNRPGGVVEGTGTLTYTNKTDSPEAGYFLVSNLGTLAPGETSRTPGSFGALNLVNVLVRFGTAPMGERTPPLTGVGTLRIAIGGTPDSPDHYDSLHLTGSNGSGLLDLPKGAGSVLNIVPAKGVTPHGTYRIVTATGVTGTFETMQYGGAPTVPYTVNYLPDGIEVVFP